MSARARTELPTDRRHIAVIGFMGAGKSTVGRRLAEKIGSPFVDLDEAIAKRAGRTVVEIFREHGEVGFRAHERAALREVLQNAIPMVLATGGGTFVDPSMRGWVQKAARTVYLKASAEALAARIGVGEGRAARPLLSGPDPMATIRRLLADREPAYELCDIVVTTEGVGSEDVVTEILSALRIDRVRPQTERRSPSARARAPSDAQRSLPLKARPLEQAEARSAAGEPPRAPDEERPDHLLIGPDGGQLVRVTSAQGAYAVELRAEAGPWLAEAVTAVCAGERVAMISDSTVARLHAPALEEALRSRGKLVTVHTFAPGEGSKSIATAGGLWDALLADGLTRGDAVLALGGGVVGDVAGFVASTLLRGVALVQVPTTTLAAVDASIGGKTGLNTSRGKNLVGTFHAPRAVLVAAAHLATQEPRGHVAGLVEALKMAATMDAELFASMRREADALVRCEPAAVVRLVGRALALKAGVVTRDEHERGERAVLNFGHTVGHAIEVGEEYRLLHGEAVGLGMLAEAAWAEREGLATGVVEPLHNALTLLGAPVDWRHARIDIAALGYDKKREGAGAVRLPVVRRIGSCELRSVPLARLTEFVQAGRSP